MKALGKALAFVMLLALVGAGTATAGNLITGGEIANGTVTGKDVKKGTLGTKHLSDAAKSSLKGATGPAGAAGPAGPAGPAGAPGEPGPAGHDGGPNRYAEVSAGGLLTGDVKNIDQTQVDHPTTAADGVYCFTFPEGDRPTSGAANGTTSDTLATLQIRPGGGFPYDCPAAANVMVRTYDVGLGIYQDNGFRLILSSN